MPLTRLALAVIAASLAALAWHTLRRPPAEPPLPPPQLAVEKAAELVTLRLRYANVLEYFQKRTQDVPMTPFELRLGGTRVLMIVRGDCEIGTELGAARYEEIRAEARALTVVLPAPRLRAARVSHAAREAGGSYFYTITAEGLELLIPNSSNRLAAINTGWVMAEKEIGAYCRSPQWIAEAKRNAEAAMAPIFEAAGWRAAFVWR